MAISTTVQANIKVGFEDQFTNLSQQAFEQFKKKASETFNSISNTNIGSFYNLKSDLSLLFSGYSALGTSFVEINDNSKNLVRSLKSLPKESLKIVANSLKALNPALIALGPHLLTAAAAIGTFALAWEAGKLLGDFKVGDKTINQYVFDAFEFWLSGDLLAKLQDSFDGLVLFMSNSASNLANTFINGINSLPEMVEGLGQAMLNAGSELVDGFGSAVIGKLKEVKNSVLSLFTEIKATLSKIPSISDVTSGVGNIIDGIGDLIGGGDSTGSSGSGGNAGFSIPKFDTGIDRVPRDMLAIIHKDEAVLNAVDAQKFRSGNQGGAVIQNLNINIPQGIGLKREQFRQLAMGLRDEIHRLDRRMSR